MRKRTQKILAIFMVGFFFLTQQASAQTIPTFDPNVVTSDVFQTGSTGTTTTVDQLVNSANFVTFATLIRDISNITTEGGQPSIQQSLDLANVFGALMREEGLTGPTNNVNAGLAIAQLGLVPNPSDPITPTDPPTDPVTPTDPPTDPVTPTDPPTDPVTPTEPTEPTEPTTPTEPTEPTDPVVSHFTDAQIEYLRALATEISNSIIRKQAINTKTVKLIKSFTNFVRFNRASANDFLKDPAAHVSYSYASVEDKNLNGSGKNNIASLSFTGGLGDNLFLGVDLSKDRYRIGGSSSFLQETHSISAFVGASPSEQLSFGAFLSYSDIDVELGNILGLPFSQDVARIGGGLLASYNTDLNERVNVSVTTMLASVNKKSLDTLLDDKDTQVSALLDANIMINDALYLTPYVNIAYLVDSDPGDVDGAYASPGFDLTWTANESWTLSAGYETVVADDSRDENRFNFSTSYNF